MKKAFKIIATIIGVIYVILCTALFFAQEKLIFNGWPMDMNQQMGHAEELFIPVSENVKLHSLYFKENKSQIGQKVILYLHGNRGNNRHCFRQAEQLVGLGYDVFMPDYRGFGKSGGYVKDEAQMFSDVEKIYQHLLTQYDERNIKILGFSLGTGMATYLAAQHNPAELILVAAFTSFIDIKNDRMPIIPSFILKYPFRNDRHLKTSSCPITLIHGTDDDVIPYRSSVELEKLDSDRIELITLPGVSHRRAIFQNEVRNAVKN